MTVTSNIATVSYIGNGATTAFPFTFPVSDQAFLLVQIQDRSVIPPITTTLTPAQYSVTGIGTDSGGIVTYAPAIPSTKSIIISRVLPYQQSVDLNNQDGFFPSTVEYALDYITMLTQQLLASQQLIVAIAGNVPSPLLGQVGYLLQAIGTGTFGWVDPNTISIASIAAKMDKSANLSDVANVITARANLGLGTAAQFNTGTSPSNVVQLDGSSRLPAVDASLLLNLPTGTGAAVMDYQVFTANGTWTKAAGVSATDLIVVEAWGGGGGGSSNATGGGGGGGAYFSARFPAGKWGATQAVVVGAGGAVNNAGGQSSVGPANAQVTPGGGGASVNTANTGGGGGGGAFTSGSNSASTNGGSGGGPVSGSGGTSGNNGTGAAFGGGGGGGGSGGNGAASGWGGAGGGGNTGSGANSAAGGGGGGGNGGGTGGISLLGGGGGNVGVAGAIPGGGGGQGAAGGRGEVRIWTIRGTTA